MITFSVITCTYNCQGTLSQTLDSVRHQTYPHVQHLIIDGASEDGTLNIARQYQQQSTNDKNHHQVIIHSEPDDGLYHAMNKALALATGQYLVFLNAGDTFPTTETLQMVAANINEAKTLPAVLYGDTDIVDQDGHFLRHRRLSPPKQLTWRSFRKGMLVCHQSFYALTEIARSIDYDTQYRYSADVDWCIRVMKEAERRNLPLKNMNCVLTHYLDGGMSIKYHRTSLKERFQVMRKHYGVIDTTLMHAWFIIRSICKR